MGRSKFGVQEDDCTHVGHAHGEIRFTIQFPLFPFWPQIDFIADPIHLQLYVPDGQCALGLSTHTSVPTSPSLRDLFLMPWCQEINSPQQRPSTTN